MMRDAIAGYVQQPHSSPSLKEQMPSSAAMILNMGFHHRNSGDFEKAGRSYSI